MRLTKRKNLFFVFESYLVGIWRGASLFIFFSLQSNSETIQNDEKSDTKKYWYFFLWEKTKQGPKIHKCMKNRYNLFILTRAGQATVSATAVALLSGFPLMRCWWWLLFAWLWWSMGMRLACLGSGRSAQ